MLCRRMNGSQETGLHGSCGNLCAGGGCQVRLETCYLSVDNFCKTARARSFFIARANFIQKGSSNMNETEVKMSGFPPVSFEEFAVPTREEWYNEAVAALKGAPFDKRMFTPTYEGITLEPIYTLADNEELLDIGGMPGEAPFLRGTKSSGYIAEPWKIAQSASDVLPKEANEVVKNELAKGATILHFELDECTKLGRDPDPELFKGDYRGLSLTTLRDADEMLKGLDYTKVPLHIYAGASAVSVLGLVAAQAKATGVKGSLKEAKGCIGADPLGELAERGTLPLPIDELYDEMALAIKWAQENAPKLKTILVRGDVYHNGGASATQETAYAMSAAIAYIRAMRHRGIEPEITMSHIKFSFSLGTNFFMEIARIRAARTVWSQIAEAFGADADEYGKIDIIARTSRFTSTVYDPYVNILRATTQAFSGAVGGVDAMQISCFDDAIRPSGEIAKRIARNIQVMLQTEFDMLQPVDPAGGSWYVERLTAQCAAAVWAILQDVDAEGGIYPALKKGVIQGEIEKILKSRLKNLAFRKDRAVGTNMYPNTLEKPLENMFPRGEKLCRERKEAVAKFRELTDEQHAAESLEKIMENIHEGDAKFLDAVIEAFMTGATVGEVRKALNDSFEGEESVKAIGTHRWTEQIEALRKTTEEFTERTGKTIRVFLANMGPIPQHKARADFSAGFMEVAHFEVLRNNGFPTPEEAVKAAVESGAEVAVICSTDDTYPELVPPVARGIKAARPEMRLLLAGAPAAEYKDSYIEAGVDDFIHVRANCYEILKSIQEKAIQASGCPSADENPRKGEGL